MSYRRPYRLRLSKPVSVGKERYVSIEEVSRRGNAIAKIQNFGAFVLGTEVGNKVTKDASRFTIAERV